MGWYKLPKPGQVVRGREIGPCVDESCKHVDCAQTRARAAQECVHCKKPIGYGVPMYYLPDGALAHADCEMKAAEKEVRP
jgi:hypothetical protein